MINLLPPTYQREIRAAYSNTLLLRYTLLLLLSIVFLLAAFGVSYLYLADRGAQADTEKQQNEQQAKNFTAIQGEATTFRNDLTKAKTLFSTDIRYSKVLPRLSALLPSGTALQGVTLTSATIEQPMTFSVMVDGQASAEELLANFAGSPYVKTASLGRITRDDTNSRYPYIAELSFTLNRSIGQ